MPRPLPKFISTEEAENLLDQTNPRCPTGLRNRAVLELMYRGGLRVSEVCNLKPGHVRWETGEVNVVNGKGGKDRVVPLPRPTVEWLQRWSDARPKKSGRFFTTLQGKPVSRHYLGQMVSRYAVKAGITQKVSPHTLRHTYATEKLHDGFTLAEVRDLLGHSNTSTTSIYLHADPELLRAKIQGEEKKAEIAALTEQLVGIEEKLDAMKQAIG